MTTNPAASSAKSKHRQIKNLLGLDNSPPQNDSPPARTTAGTAGKNNSRQEQQQEHNNNSIQRQNKEIMTAPVVVENDSVAASGSSSSPTPSVHKQQRRSHKEGHGGHSRRLDLNKADSKLANLAVASLEFSSNKKDEDDDNNSNDKGQGNPLPQKVSEPQHPNDHHNVNDHDRGHVRQSRTSHGGHRRSEDLKKQDSQTANIAMAGLRLKHSMGSNTTNK
mmetsp:Transcript_17205/g.37540  ORF Transcript_17205/g.37540 Transcript_17205/m.37540 type:complete len:221 (-) Transcript_17205:194-856(-)